jgi:hypothetical protein
MKHYSQISFDYKCIDNPYKYIYSIIFLSISILITAFTISYLTLENPRQAFSKLPLHPCQNKLPPKKKKDCLIWAVLFE